MTLIDTGTAGLVLNARTAEFVRSPGYLILAKIDPKAAHALGRPHGRSTDEISNLAREVLADSLTAMRAARHRGS
jgi:hypothetical protein